MRRRRAAYWPTPARYAMTLSLPVGILALAAAAVALACSGGSYDRSPRASSSAMAHTGAVLYTVGVSTDPYGNSSPGGFGVVTGFGSAGEMKDEIRSRDLGFFAGAEWIGERRILVPRKAPPFRPPLIFRLAGGNLVREGPSPLPPLDAQQEWSPDGKLIASQPIEPCAPNQRPRWKCYRQGDEIYLQAADGSRRRVLANGHFDSWTPDGRLLVVVGPRGAFYHYRALNVRSGRRTLPLSPERAAAAAGLQRAALGPPRWSADGRYIAAMVAGKWPKKLNVFTAVVIARADGQPIRVITSPYVISMFAWSPRGHRLAWTTSGFPTPHELFVLDDPSGKPRRLFAADPHFDWIAWSPDGQRLLLDDEHAGRWLLVSATARKRVEERARLGGRPYWCCPVNAYATFNG
jgi:hypothetical protein